MKPEILRLIALALGVILLASAFYRTDSAPVMAEAANRFLAALTPEQRARAVFRFDDQERFNWHYTPVPRKGLPLKEMDAAQKHLASALLSAGLSQKGHIKAATVMSLEEVLRILEKDSGERRDPEKYYFSIFGEPSATGTWGYRVEGHHLSLNFTVAGGKISGSPGFFGANPAEVKQGPRKGLRALAAEEDLGRKLVNSLDAGQRKIAIVDAAAYPDILTKASRKAALEGHPSGLSAAKMNQRQREMLTALLEEYAYDLPEQLALARMNKVREAGTNLSFAWAGGTGRGEPHYYRVQGPAFLVEYDNTQDHANHIHSVWRDFEGDWGLDVLKMHYQTSHHTH